MSNNECKKLHFLLKWMVTPKKQSDTTKYAIKMSVIIKGV